MYAWLVCMYTRRGVCFGLYVCIYKKVHTHAILFPVNLRNKGVVNQSFPEAYAWFSYAYTRSTYTVYCTHHPFPCKFIYITMLVRPMHVRPYMIHVQYTARTHMHKFTTHKNVRVSCKPLLHELESCTLRVSNPRVCSTGSIASFHPMAYWPDSHACVHRLICLC